MSEYIDRDEALVWLRSLGNRKHRRESGTIQEAENLIKLMPKVDLVPVVRCKDCVYCGFCGEATNLGVMGFNGYCSRGKSRKECYTCVAYGDDYYFDEDGSLVITCTLCGKSGVTKWPSIT